MKIKVPRLLRYIAQPVLLAYFKLHKIYKPSLLSSLKIENLKKKSVYSPIVLIIFLLATALVVSSLGAQTANAVGITKYARSAGGNWSADATWSTTSNGAADTTKPTASDDVVFDASSGPVTIGAASVAKSIDCTGYTNTLTHNAFTLTVIGSITFVAGMTYTPLATSTVIMGGNGTLTTGGKLMPLVNIVSNSTVTLGDNLSFMASPVMKFTLSGTAVDLNGKTVSGNSAINRLLIQSGSAGAARDITISAGTFANADFQDITFTNGANLDLSAITGLSGDCGGNTLAGGYTLTFTAADTQTWTTNASGNWSGANWTGTILSRAPLPQDDVVMNKGSAYASGVVITADMPRLGKSISWTGVTWTGTATKWTLSGTIVGNTSYGNLTLISGMTLTHSSGYYYLAGRSSYTVTTATKVMSVLGISAPGGTYTLANALSAGSLIVTAGNFSTAGYNVTISAFLSNSTITRSVDITNSTITISGANGWQESGIGLTLTTTGSTIALTYAGATATPFFGDSHTYNNISISPGAGVLTFSGAFTFANMTMASAGTKTVKFTKNSTYTMTGSNFLSGTAGNLVTIDSNDGVTQFTLSNTTVNYVSVDYINLKNSAATQGVFYAGSHSTGASGAGNSGWIFNDPIVISNAGGNWGDTTTWVSGVVPDSTNGVFASATSGNVTIDVDAACLSIDLSNYTGTLTQNADVTLSVGGSLKFGAGMTYTPINNITSIIAFVSTTTGNTLTWAGKSVGSIVFNGAGGGWTFQDAATINGNFTITNSDTVGNGVDLNNQQVTVGGNFQIDAGS